MPAEARMRSRITDMLGIEQPVLAFSHSPRVVAAVSRAGGMGVMGAAQMRPDRLEEALAWIDANCDGRPYGVDLIIPAQYAGKEEGGLEREQIAAELPDEHKRFVDGLLDEHEIPPLERPHAYGERIEGHKLPVPGNASYNRRDALPLVDVALESNVSLFANALGTPSRDIVDRMHERDILVAALAGQPRHAEKHHAGGVDIVVAQGYEAGGHTGDVASMVLIPDVVDAVAPMPVLAAGGVASGRQFAAALVLGADGVWTGSMWLNTEESETLPVIREKFERARTGDTIRSRSSTGRPARHLKSGWTDVWERPDTPEPLGMPHQGVLTAEAQVRIEQAAERGDGHADELVTYFVGQVVGRLGKQRTVAEAMEGLVGECEEVLEGSKVLQRLARA